MPSRDSSRPRFRGDPAVDPREAVLQRLLASTRLLAPLQSEREAARTVVDCAVTVFAAPSAALFDTERGPDRLIAASGRWAELPDGPPAADRAHALSVPLSGAKRPLGVLYLCAPCPQPPPTVLDIFAAHAAAALDNAREYRRATEATRRQDDDLATLAHELRNPLGAIISALRLLERTAPPDAHLARLRAIIGRQAKHLDRLVEDVLDLARLRHGKLRLTREPVDVRDIVRQAVDTLLATGQGEHRRIEPHLAPAPVVVVGDATRLEQVVRNLLDNAVKYSPNDSVIEVAVDAGESDAILCVRDGGIGIDAEMLPRLFDQFAQADSTTGRRAGGLGLGLPLVRAIVEEHGGSIAARSEGVGRGSEFTVRLPRG